MNNFIIKNLYANEDGQANGTNDVQYKLWRKFIEAMNNRATDLRWSGDSLGDYYGVVDDIWTLISNYESIPYGVQMITIEQWNTMYIASQIVDNEVPNDEPMQLCFDGELYPAYECSEFSRDSIHEGNWFHSSHKRAGEVVYCEYGDCFAHEDEVSSCNGYYFITEEGYNHNIEWSEYNNDYICTDNCESHYGVYDRRGNEGWFYCDDYVYAYGTYYADADVAEANGLFYDDDEGEWYKEEDRRASVKHCNATYHDLCRKNRFTIAPKFSIGFEIEKEDGDAGLIEYQELYDSTNGWIKESDGSLNEDGYELVSPAFDLYSDLLDKEIKSSKDLITLINGNTSHRCGGHINVASSEYTPDQLFEGLSGFLPLIYSMYPHRINVDYSKAKKKHEYFNKSKYSAVFIKDHLVEFRIFSGVKSIENLLWRRDLIRIMCDNINKSEKEVLRMLVSPTSKLHKHMRKVYTHEGLVDKIIKFVDHSAFYNNKKIDPVNVDAIKKTSTGITMSTSDELAC